MHSEHSELFMPVRHALGSAKAQTLASLLSAFSVSSICPCLTDGVLPEAPSVICCVSLRFASPSDVGACVLERFGRCTL